MPQAFGPLHRQSVLSITTKSIGGSIAADGRRGVRWQSVGRHLPGHVPLPGATWSFGKTGLTNGDPQHAGCKRLWPARQQDAGAQAQLLRRAAMAEAHGNDGARIWCAHPGGPPRLRTLPARHAWRRRSARHQYRQSGTANAGTASIGGALHFHLERSPSQRQFN
jgi:hypothetical protein